MTGTQGEGHLTETTAHGWGPAHDRRRTHYLKALELLGNTSAITRLGGVRMLAQLADEWLADTSIPAPVGREQAQTIVDMLCAYVRLPFPQARNCPQAPASTPERSSDTGMARQHRIDEAEYLAEAQVRSRILAEIRGRVCQPQPLEDTAAGGEATPGPWSGFYFEFFDSASFSSAEFFFPVDFSGSYWGEGLYCPGAFFAQSVTFSNSFYGGNVSFIGTHCQGIADFSGCTYAANADFGVTRYMSPVTFSECIYRGEANFNENQYGERADFSGSTFGKEAVFADSVYSTKTVFSYSVFSAATDFSNIVLAGSSPSFKKCVFAVGKKPARREFKRA